MVTIVYRVPKSMSSLNDIKKSHEEIKEDEHSGQKSFVITPSNIEIVREFINSVLGSICARNFLLVHTPNSEYSLVCIFPNSKFAVQCDKFT